MTEFVFISSGYRGGATRFIEQHVDYLFKNKKKITLIDDNPLKTYANFNLKQVKVIKIPINSDFMSSYEKLNFFFKKKNKVNIFISNYTIYIKYFFLLSNLQKSNNKIILTIHSGLLNFSITSYLGAFIFSFLSRKVNHLYFGSLSSKNWWLTRFPWFTNKNYKIIYNGIKIPKKKIYIKKKIKINVSFVGRVELENNPELFLRLAKESFLSGGFYNFHVFGDGSLLRILKKNYSQYAKFHNWKKIDDIYKITNLLVITSKVNNFPYVALEAKSYGVPVLSCSKGDISKIIKNNKDGYLILSHSPNQLLKYLNIMKKRYNSLVKYSLKSRYKFNLEKSCRKFWQSII